MKISCQGQAFVLMAGLRGTSLPDDFFYSPQPYCCHLASKVLNSSLGCLARLEKVGVTVVLGPMPSQMQQSPQQASGKQHRDQVKGKTL